ncbi:MAG: acyl-CoA dehydrogenase [Mariprofundaceae bacterium]
MQWLILVLFILVLLYLRAKFSFSLMRWSLILIVLLTVLPYLGLLDPALAGFLWAIFLIVFVPLYAHDLRREYLVKPLFKLMKIKLPVISDSEKEAMQSGTVGWDAQLFSGYPDWSVLDDIAKPKLTESEQYFLDHDVQALCGMLDDWQITHVLNDLPEDVWCFMKQHGFFGMIIPKTYGGLEFSAYAHSQVIQKISSCSLSAAVTVMVPNSLGPAELLLSYGTEQQKTYYLPRLANGEEVPCFALTSPQAGSDATAMTDKGMVCKGEYQGEQVLGFMVNWEKRYITLGPVATVLGLAFHAYDPDGLLGDKVDLGISCALIPVGTIGLSIGARHYPLNAAFMNGPNSGKDVFVPMDWMIGGQEYVGRGWQMLVERLAVGRGISLPSLSVGAAKRVSQTTGAYARIRKQFHRPIGQFEGVQEAMARIAGLTYMMDATRILTLSMLDQGERPAVITAMVKYYLTENMRKVVNDGMDIHGGRGICMGPSNYLARMYQTIPVGITVEGANILTRSLIIFGQGSIRCHPYIQQEMQALQEDDMTKFDGLIVQHAEHVAGNAARSFMYALTGAYLAPCPVQDETASYYRQLARFAASFALVSDMALMLLGGELKRKEMLSARFSDALAHLYMCSACLKKFNDDGHPAADLILLEWSCQYALYQVQEALYGIIRHFPMRLVSWKLYALVFPLGRRLKLPNDSLKKRLAEYIQQPGEARNRLIDGIEMPDSQTDIFTRLEYALQLTIKSEPIEKRLQKAGVVFLLDDIASLIQQGLLTQCEADLLLQKESAVRFAIDVDDFSV